MSEADSAADSCLRVCRKALVPDRHLSSQPLQSYNLSMAEKDEEAAAAAPASQNGEDLENLEDPEKLKELIELPPFEIVTGERLPVNFFKFQFRNVEYSSGRNKTFLCYVVEAQSKGGQVQATRGYLEDEHAAAHAEEAFFNNIMPAFDSALRYNVTWYVSSSPCAACADRIVKTLSNAKNLRLLILVGRLFMWEEPEIRAAIRKLKEAGCKLRIMKPQDFEYALHVASRLPATIETAMTCVAIWDMPDF
ncbi:C-_U-editing enzyme APOBEC-2 [Manis javanica]|nr:C->U-editing enzyme APOBEC-2 [Manis javanica]